MQENIDEILKKVAQKQLAPARIIDLESERAKDHDGDPILRIRVVYEAKDDRLEPKKVLGLFRCLRQPLREIDADLFPIFTFMSEEEVKTLESV